MTNFSTSLLPPFVCVQYSDRKHVLLSCLGLRWLSDVVMANKYLYLLIIFQSSHIFFLLIWFWCQIISWNCSMSNVILCNFKISWICILQYVKLKFTHLQKLREIAVCHTYIFHSFSENLVKLLAVSHKNPITIRQITPPNKTCPHQVFWPSDASAKHLYLTSFPLYVKPFLLFFQKSREISLCQTYFAHFTKKNS